MFDAIVVGAGIFGSLITRGLRQFGMSVLTLDAKLENSGSRPAACLMRPGWFASLGKDIYEPALARLDTLVGVHDLTFRVNSLATATVHWCDPKGVLLDQNEVRSGRVFSIATIGKSKSVTYSVGGGLPKNARAKHVFIATGIWTPTLYNIGVDVSAQAGVAWLWPHEKIEEPFVRVWAPYKQIVAFNRGDGLWVGDGLSIKNWSTAYRDKSYYRCSDAVGITRKSLVVSPVELFGYRPYVKDAKPCFLKEVEPNLWVVTGGAKNGTLAAGWCVDQILRRVA